MTVMMLVLMSIGGLLGKHGMPKSVSGHGKNSFTVRLSLKVNA